MVCDRFWRVLGGASCADKSQQNVNRGEALTGFGFKVVLANTPERQDALRQLPPQKFLRQMRGEKVVYVYADPANCGCLYVGSQTAYGAYHARALDKQTADERATTAINNWNLSPWAVGFPDD
jgi:hypothetical protein